MPMQNDAVSSEIRSDMDTLRSDLSQLRSDVVTMAQKIFGRGRAGIGEARHRAEEALGDLGERGKHVLEDVQHRVERNPAAAVGAALGIGFVLGMLLTSGRRR